MSVRPCIEIELNAVASDLAGDAPNGEDEATGRLGY